MSEAGRLLKDHQAASDCSKHNTNQQRQCIAYKITLYYWGYLYTRATISNVVNYNNHNDDFISSFIVGLMNDVKQMAQVVVLINMVNHMGLVIIVIGLGNHPWLPDA